MQKMQRIRLNNIKNKRGKFTMSILEDINEMEPNETIEDTTSIIENSTSRIGMDLKFLQAKTGEGTIEDYIDHPMNINKSKGLGQLIRGFTGLFGALDLAIIDIVVGLMHFAKERKEVKPIVN